MRSRSYNVTQLLPFLLDSLTLTAFTGTVNNLSALRPPNVKNPELFHRDYMDKLWDHIDGKRETDICIWKSPVAFRYSIVPLFSSSHI